MPVGDLIRGNAQDDARAQHVFLQFDDARITFAAYHAECVRWANLFLRIRVGGMHAAPPEVPFHVGVLLDNIPDYFFALGGAALAGAVIVGINNTKRGTHLARDIAHTDCQILVTEEKYLPMLAPVIDELHIAAPRFLVTRRWHEDRPAVDADGGPGPAAGGTGAEASMPLDLETLRVTDLDTALLEHGSGADPAIRVGDADAYVLVFTSGTVTAPKAVVCSHSRMVETGKTIGANIYALTPQDVGYIAMPLFHANALMCGLMPALSYGAGLAMIRKFSKSRWLSDVRRYGATFFNYTGKPLAYILSTPARPDDHVNPLRICYGNEGSQRVVAEFEARFGCHVIDVFGSSEGGVGVTRQPGDPPLSIGMPAFGIRVVDAHGIQRPPARFDADGRLLNADEAIGEIVNTQGQAWFEGYYKNPEATQRRTRHGWYWTGDLGYTDERGYLYFAGRDVEWLRVDGENFVGRPIEEILLRFPAVALAAVYGVPDADGGDRVMAALVLREGARFDPQAFAVFLRAQPDLSPKWAPTYVRIARQLPQTASAKVLKTELRRQKFRADACADPIYWRPRPDAPYRLFTAADYDRLRARFAALGKLALLEI
jgi:fatty-acyl-CoA synthase